MYPGPACWLRPLIDTVRSPSLTRIISSHGCRCTGCEIIPGARVVTWTSSFSRVGVGLSKTGRISPTGVVRGVSESQSMNVVPSTVESAGGRIRNGNRLGHPRHRDQPQPQSYQQRLHAGQYSRLRQTKEG